METTVYKQWANPILTHTNDATYLGKQMSANEIQSTKDNRNKDTDRGEYL